ncbi:MAG: hypothetical protein LCH59_06480 [Proteobacteria bacterium]|nr:hypothetical protein [Pseudomonadota bacterium]
MTARTVWPQALTLRTTLPGLRLRVADSGGDRLVVELHKGRWPTSITVVTQVVHRGDPITPDRSVWLPAGCWFASTLIVLHSPAELEKLEHWLDSMPPEVAAHFHMPGRATHQEAAA